MDLMLRPAGPPDFGGDLIVQDDDFVLDDGLNTAILISLFSDRRAEPGDETPDPESGRRGWWGDCLNVDPADRLGSRLWELERRKQIPETRQLFLEFTREALSWMLSDGVAAKIDVSAEWSSSGFLLVYIVVHKPDGERVLFDYAWDSELKKLEIVKNAL
jgi:phage gp46-like protein